MIIDDCQKDSLIIKRILAKEWPGLLVERVETATALSEALDQQEWDCIICDMVLPGFGAPAALDIIRKTGSDLPFIIVSANVNIADVISLLKAGANDFVRMDELARLVPAIARSMEDVEILRRQHQTEIKLKESEEQHRTLIEQSPFSIQVHSPHGEGRWLGIRY